MAYERVYTVSNYYDGPREGLADYKGQPHRYQSQWDEVADDWAETFVLTPVDDVTFNLEMEQWQIWRDWERAFHTGEVSHDSHPGFGGKNLRFDELEKLVALRMRDFKPLEVYLAATFRIVEGQEAVPPGVMRELEVEWCLSSDKLSKHDLEK
jgi:hypothetical protein